MVMTAIKCARNLGVTVEGSPTVNLLSFIHIASHGTALARRLPTFKTHGAVFFMNTSQVFDQVEGLWPRQSCCRKLCVLDRRC